MRRVGRSGRSRGWGGSRKSRRGMTHGPQAVPGVIPLLDFLDPPQPRLLPLRPTRLIEGLQELRVFFDKLAVELFKSRQVARDLPDPLLKLAGIVGISPPAQIRLAGELLVANSERDRVVL